MPTCHLARMRGLRHCGIYDCDVCYGPDTRWMVCTCGWQGSASECGARACDVEPGVITSSCPMCTREVRPMDEVNSR